MKRYLVLFIVVLCLVGCENATHVANKTNKNESEYVEEEAINKENDMVSESNNNEKDSDIESDNKKNSMVTKSKDKENNTVTESNEPSFDKDGNPTTTSYIPKGLLDILSDTILNSSEEDALKDMVSDKNLSNKEIAAYTSDATVKEYKKQFDEYGGYVLLVDADNDGIDDLFFLLNDGGSMGNNSRILLKGNKDGSFQMTSEKMEVTQELSFIKYDGKNYLIETSFDYNNKEYNGIYILEFVDGIIYEKVYLTLTANGYDISIHTSENKYKDLAEKASDMAQKHYDIANMDGEILIGDAETALKETDYESYEKNLYFQDYNWFSSDVNNDGIKEIYTKGIFLTSTIHTVTCLQDAFITDLISESDMYPDVLTYCNIKEKGTVEMFWVSTVDKANIINLITYSGITDYGVNGYYVKGDTVSKVYGVNFKGNRKVVPTIYTRGINYVDDEDGWE